MLINRISIKKSDPTSVWLWSYVLINIVATIWMLSSGELLGDAKGLALRNVDYLLVASIAVVLSYVIILVPVFKFCLRVKSKRLHTLVSEDELNNRLGVFLFIAQLAFFAFNLSYGVNIAGSGNIRADTPIGMIWIILPVDSLFLIYYASARDSKYWWLNLAVYLVSNILRGWLGMFLFVIFLEWCRAYRLNKIRWKGATLVGLFVIFIYPVILNLKWIFRAADSKDLSLVSAVSTLFETISDGAYSDVIIDGIGQIISRLQITSMVEEVIRFSSALQVGFDAGTFKPFWLDGIHGIMFDKIFYSQNRMSIGVAFTSIGDFGNTFDIGSWNTNTGWVGWLFVAPGWIALLFLYTALLCVLSVYLAKKIGMGPLMRDLVWFAWLIYLLPGWLGGFVGFIYALAVFLGLKVCLSSLPRIAARKARRISYVRPEK
jgi:hypothetical protein